MCGIEFFLYNKDLWYISDGISKRFDENDTEIVDMVITTIRENYPSAFKALQDIYKGSAMNVRYYRWLISNRFCKCNFGNLDSTETDISKKILNFEKVSCPMRGECKLEGIVCNPTFKSPLSEAEKRVMKLIYDGVDLKDTADRLFLSVNTIKNHIKSVYNKLGIHEKAEFVRYATRHNLFAE